jgi:hypothetical protein
VNYGATNQGGPKVQQQQQQQSSASPQQSGGGGAMAGSSSQGQAAGDPANPPTYADVVQGDHKVQTA